MASAPSSLAPVARGTPGAPLVACAVATSGAAMVIVFNPAAGRRRASLLWRVLDVLVANGVRLDLAETLRPGHAEALARDAVGRGETMVVAAGGDGTIAEVANGLMGSSVRLGIIPLGTANVLAHELGLPFAPRAVAAALAFGRTRLLWPGLAQGEGVGASSAFPDPAWRGHDDPDPLGGPGSARAWAQRSGVRAAARLRGGVVDGMGTRAARPDAPRAADGRSRSASPPAGASGERAAWHAAPAGGGPEVATPPPPATDGGSGAQGDGAVCDGMGPSRAGEANAGATSACGDALRPGAAHASGPAANQRLFVQMLGVGFDAQVVHTLPVGLKRLFGKGAYVLQTLNTLRRYDYRPIRLRIDGMETAAASVIVSKGVLYGGRFRLAPAARPEEPGFSVVLFDHAGAAAALLYGMALPLHLLQSGAGVRHVRAERVDFFGRCMPVQTDGDAAGFAPLSVTAAPGPIRVIAA